MPGDWTNQAEITSHRAKQAIAYGDKLAAIVSGLAGGGFDDLLPMIDPDRFVRRGNERDETMDWPTYRAMLEQWMGQSGHYAKRLHRATEAGDVVYLDLDEHTVATDGTENSLRSISIYEFDDQDRIVAVDVCMGFHRQG